MLVREEEWNKVLSDYKEKYAEEAAEFERYLSGKLPDGWEKELSTYTPEDKGLATRKYSEACLNKTSSRNSRINWWFGRFDPLKLD